MKLTQEQIIIKYLNDCGDWVESYRLQKQETPYGFLGTSADRVARLLSEHGKIERKREGKYAYYRIKQEPEQLTLV